MGENSQGKKLLIRAFSAGGVVFRRINGQEFFLVIKPAGTDRWQLPKGTIDKGETSQIAAIREVKEEGGVKTKILQKLGNSQYFFALKGERVFKNVTYFLMQYLSDTKEGHDKEVDEAIFVPFKEAYKKLTFKDDRETLKKAKEILDQGIQPNLV